MQSLDVFLLMTNLTDKSMRSLSPTVLSSSFIRQETPMRSPGFAFYNQFLKFES